MNDDTFANVRCLLKWFRSWYSEREHLMTRQEALKLARRELAMTGELPKDDDDAT